MGGNAPIPGGSAAQFFGLGAGGAPMGREILVGLPMGANLKVSAIRRAGMAGYF